MPSSRRTAPFGLAAAIVVVPLAGLAPPSPPAPAAQDTGAGMSRGVALLEQFRFTEAAAEFERVAGLRPDSVAAHLNLGIAWFNERDFEAARASFQRALALDPEDLHAHYNLGLIDKLEGNSEAALDAFRRVASGDPDDSMTQYYLGSAYAALGRLDEAEAALRAAIALTPDHESAHFSLGNVLVRAGRRDEGRAQLMRFQELKASGGGGVSAGLQYTELGPYAEAVEERPAPLYQPRAVAAATGSLALTPRTAEWNLELVPLPAPPDPPAAIAPEDYSAEWAARFLIPGLGSGVAFRDLDDDGRPDLLFVRGGAVELFRNGGSGFVRWEDHGIAVRNAVSATIGDVDRDGRPDVYVAAAGPNGLFRNRLGDEGGSGGPAFEAVEGAAAGDGAVSVGATFADFDHDGDLDIYVANYAPATLEPPAGGAGAVAVPGGIPGAPNRLYRNNGDGSFTETAGATRTDGGPLRSLGAVFSDWDEDRDIDFLVVNDGAPVQVFSNDRVGTFTEVSEAWGVETAGRMRGASAADFDRDGFFDLALTAEGSALNLLLRGPPSPAFVPDTASPALLRAGVPRGRHGVSLLDADQDMDLDLLMVVNEPGAVLAAWENTPGGFVRAADLAAPLEPGEEARALALADVDGDGALDAVAGTTRGRLLAFGSEPPASRNWVAVRTRGLRSNLDGIGTKVEVRVGAVSQRRQVRAATGYLSQDDLPLHFGLGEASGPDYVRFLWPGGVKQIELGVPAGQLAAVEELNRKGTSCPVLYAWDGERIRFVTDFLGGSALGNLLAPGLYNTPDTTEVVKMEAFDLAPRDGFFEMRWVNQLEEVIFYDRAALWAADHPEAVDVFPRERLMPGPPYPPPGLVAVRNRRPPRRAVASSPSFGEADVTEALRAVDRTYVEGFRLLPFKGYAEPHDLILEFDRPAPAADAGPEYVLLLYGWVDYADSSSNLAASQAGVAAAPPVLEVGGAEGFRPLADPMGFPAGLPKTMVVPLPAGSFAPGAPLRIRTNMRIYWDRIELAEVAADAPVEIHRLDPATADFRFAGYPKPHRPLGQPPTEYDYGTLAVRDVWGAHEGDYTRYGDVRPLLTGSDNRYVIARHGDEMQLRFDAAELPEAEAGTRRTWFAFADGFGKDMDLNSARPHTVGPLPFHGMPGYPYPDGAYPDSPGLARWRAEYNTRRVGPEGRYGFLDGLPGVGSGTPAETGAERGRQGPGERR